MRDTTARRGAPLVALLGVLLSVLAACADDSSGGSANGERLTDDTLAAWQACIEPDADELAYQRIPWLATYVDGVIRADTERKPLLLWIMNGHPLGCT
ncbi:MAG: hypothetical protein ACYTCU_04795 [Planctomycetota bacterium]